MIQVLQDFKKYLKDIPAGTEGRRFRVEANKTWISNYNSDFSHRVIQK